MPGRHFWGQVIGNWCSPPCSLLSDQQCHFQIEISPPGLYLLLRYWQVWWGERDTTHKEQILMNYRECGFSVGRMLPDPSIGRAHILRTQTPVTSCHSDPEAWISPAWAKGRCGSTHSEWAQPATRACSSSQLHRLSILCFGVERGQNRNAGNDSGDRQPWSESSFHFLLAGSSWESNLTSLL